MAKYRPNKTVPKQTMKGSNREGISDSPFCTPDKEGNSTLRKSFSDLQSNSEDRGNFDVLADSKGFNAKPALENQGQTLVNSRTRPTKSIHSAVYHRKETRPAQSDGPFDTRRPSVAAKASPFVAEQGTTGLETTRATSVMKKNPLVSSEEEFFQAQLEDAQSAINQPVLSNGPRSFAFGRSAYVYSGEDQPLVAFEPVRYLDLGDSLRYFIDKRMPINDTELEGILSILENMLKHEAPGKDSITYPTIVFSRFEKIIDGLVHYKTSGQNLSGALGGVIKMAILLQRSWQRRFKSRLFTVEEDRLKQLIGPGGALAHVILRFPVQGGWPVWVLSGHSRPANRELCYFEVGQWWINIPCTYRDGMVNILDGRMKYGPNEMPTLSLLQGTETLDKKSDSLMWEFEGHLHEMKLHLQSKVGKKFRMLRGYKLKSLNSPEVGIRYDGIYYLTDFGHQMIDQNKALYRVVLRYHEVEGESGICLYTITPSRMDDWRMYKRIEDEEVKKACDPETYSSWRKAEKEEEEAARDWIEKKTLIYALARLKHREGR